MDRTELIIERPEGRDRRAVVRRELRAVAAGMESEKYAMLCQVVSLCTQVARKAGKKTSLTTYMCGGAEFKIGSSQRKSQPSIS